MLNTSLQNYCSSHKVLHWFLVLYQNCLKSLTITCIAALDLPGTYSFNKVNRFCKWIRAPPAFYFNDCLSEEKPLYTPSI